MYKDRGIIKWMPFDALSGYQKLINKLVLKEEKIKRPILMEDKLNELDYILKEAINFNLEIEVKYYENGFIKTSVGTINNIDIINKKVTISNSLELYVKNILDIKK